MCRVTDQHVAQYMRLFAQASPQVARTCTAEEWERRRGSRYERAAVEAHFRGLGIGKTILDDEFEPVLIERMPRFKPGAEIADIHLVTSNLTRIIVSSCNCDTHSCAP